MHDGRYKVLILDVNIMLGFANGIHYGTIV